MKGRNQLFVQLTLSRSKQGVSLRGSSFQGKKEHISKDMINLGFWQYRTFSFLFLHLPSTLYFKGRNKE